MSERLRAVVERMRIRPSDRVLEIGCGQGVAATLVCERLEEGRLTAVDRSRKMIDAAIRRNASFVRSGKAEFLCAALEELDLGARRFDKVFAVRVGLFRREPARARRLAERWLAPGGEVFVEYDPPRRPGPSGDGAARPCPLASPNERYAVARPHVGGGALKKSRNDSPAVDAYLASLPEAEREALQRLRLLVKETVPGVEERISYGATVMFSLGRDLVGFAAQPRHLSFFTASPALAKAMRGEITRTHELSGATIHFAPDRPLPADLVAEILRARLGENAEASKSRRS